VIGATKVSGGYKVFMFERTSGEKEFFGNFIGTFANPRGNQAMCAGFACMLKRKTSERNELTRNWA
jgi:hypothetical protein